MCSCTRAQSRDKREPRKAELITQIEAEAETEGEAAVFKSVASPARWLHFSAVMLRWRSAPEPATSITCAPARIVLRQRAVSRKPSPAQSPTSTSAPSATLTTARQRGSITRVMADLNGAEFKGFDQIDDALEEIDISK